MSGGCRRVVSFMQWYSRSIWPMFSKSSLPAGVPRTAACSAMTRASSGLSLMRWMAVHVVVMLLVCWPAKSSAMRMPAMCSSGRGPAPLYSASMSTCRMSSCFSPDSRRLCSTDVKMATIALRALLRFQCCGIGAFGQKIDSGVMPLSRSANRFATASNRFSRISGPMSEREAVRMMRRENSSRRSTSPLAGQVAKNASHSRTISGT
mmetsp:Transcript_4971/g.17989  ORF Transcript_4971/g.17989 Transcript_4971/m.17989 type:complete len:207 (+) Transcript_4971:568-1188(+)